MLIEFTVGNYYSIKEPVTLSMVAANLKSENSSIDENNTFAVDKNLSLLTSAAIYGANASGKSNLIQALGFMRTFVLSSVESRTGNLIPVTPFRLDQDYETAPSSFEVIFREENVVFRYGFEVEKERVVREWCFYSPRGREAKLFTRESDQISISRAIKGGAKLKPLTRNNVLFLTVAAKFNNDIAVTIVEWFSRLIVLIGIGPNVAEGTTKLLYENPEFRKKITNLIRESDVGISDLIAEKESLPKEVGFPDDMPQPVRDYIYKQIADDPELLAVRAVHRVRTQDGKSKEVKFNLHQESDGTQRLFYLSGPVIDSLNGPRVLVIDEISASMHTFLTREIVRLYNSKETNPKNAQLIFTSHDTNLLNKNHFRRDQIWFIEKDHLGASHLYSLAELKVRNDAPFESEYLFGKYGGLPVLGNLHTMMSVTSEDDCGEEKITA